MSTGDVYLQVTTGRILGATDLSDKLITYLRDRLGDLATRTFSLGGTFSTLTLASPGANQITVTGAGPATDGLGNIFDPDSCIDGVNDFMEAVGFQNTLGIVYHVALHYAEMPADARQNPLGYPEYVGIREFIGETGDPSTVVDNGNGTITLTISSLLENIQGTPRKAYVWLKLPKTHASNFKELCTVTWDGANSKITTSTLLGQSVASTTVADYTILVPGPTIRRNTDLSQAAGYAYVGKVTGAGLGNVPTQFNILDQRHIDTSLSDLNEALDNYSHEESLTGTNLRAGPGTALAGTARFASGSVAFGTQIFIMGGDSALPAGTCVNENHSLNTLTGAWTAKTVIPTQGYAGARSGMRCVTDGTSKIYVLGGGDNSAAPNFATNLVQQYDPNANTWGAVLASMPGARRDIYSGYYNGKIYVVGGIDNNNTATNTFWIYDVAGNSWTTKTPFANTYSNGGAAVVDGQFYMVGGLKNGSPTAEVWRYDPPTDSWLALAPLAAPVARCRCTVVNGLIHVFGGSDATAGITNSHQVYNPSRNGWNALRTPPMQVTRSYCAEGVDGTIHIIGGVTRRNAVDSIVANHVQVDVTAIHLAGAAGLVSTTGKTWIRHSSAGGGTVSIASKPNAMRSAPCCTDGNAIYFVCGEDSAGNASGETWVYYPESDTYDRLQDCPAARKWGGCVYHPRENAIYAFGGNTAGFDITSLERFDLATKTWSSITIAVGPSKNGFGSGVLVGDRIYLFGGGSGGVTTASATNQCIDLRTRTMIAIANLPAARRWSCNVALPKAGFAGAESTEAHIYVMGGDAGGNVLNTIYVYNTTTDVWVTAGPTLTVTRGYAECVPVPGTTKAVISGGVSPTVNATQTVTVIDLATFTQTNVTSISAARLLASCAVIGGMIYTFSGSSGSSAAMTAQSTAYLTYGGATILSPQRSKPQNYQTGYVSDVIGVKEIDMYGFHAWLQGESMDLVITGDQ